LIELTLSVEAQGDKSPNKISEETTLALWEPCISCSRFHIGPALLEAILAALSLAETEMR